METQQSEGRRDGHSAGLGSALAYLRKWFVPGGVFLVVLGPDGVGKSTTIRYLQIELEKLFGVCRTERWRPGLIRKVAPDTGHRIPHAKIPRGPIGSVVSVLGLALDFNVGYVLAAHPAMARSEVVIFDRYFHDLLIDPRRYRYAGPMLLPRLLSRWIPPRRAIFVVLDAEEELVLNRKQELPLDELRRQRLAYKAFAERMPQSMLIRTDRPVVDVVSEIVDNVITIRKARSATDNRKWQHKDASVAS